MPISFIPAMSPSGNWPKKVRSFAGIFLARVGHACGHEGYGNPGAGNVLGTQQHGNMDSIGFDLYSRNVGQEIAHLKGEPTAAEFTPFAFIRRDRLFSKGLHHR